MTNPREFAEGIAALVLTFLGHVWADLLPALSGLSVLCGCILGVHGVVSLIRGRTPPHHIPHSGE